MKDCPAEVDVVLGDGRLALEQEQSHQFDVLIVDAFTGDAIPAHLLTVEAMAIYRKQLKPNGLLAIHVSNRHVDLFPVVTALADHNDLNWVQIETKKDVDSFRSWSQWMFLSNNKEFFNSPAIQNAAHKRSMPNDSVLWTDEYSNLVSLLK